jgi:hypothetical protein
MSQFHLQLRVDAPGRDGDRLARALTEASQRVRASLYRRLGLKVHSNAWVTIALGSDKGHRTVQAILEECRAGNVVAGSATVVERLDEEATAAADWFYVTTKTADRSFSLWDDYPSYAPGSVAGQHVMNHTFVSDEFVQACERSGLRGLSFLRCRSRGRKPARAWFAALPDQGLGHGLDHPWFDRRLWIRDVGDHPARRSSSLDTGQNCFHQRWLRLDLGPEAEFLVPLLELFPPPRPPESTLSGLTLVTVPRYWARVFPDADFAYVPWGEDGPNREGKPMRFRQLVVSRRARQVLIDARLLAPKALLAVRSIVVPEAGIEVLDEHHGPVPAMYTPDELAALRLEERRLFGTRTTRPPVG